MARYGHMSFFEAPTVLRLISEVKSVANAYSVHRKPTTHGPLALGLGRRRLLSSCGNAPLSFVPLTSSIIQRASSFHTNSSDNDKIYDAKHYVQFRSPHHQHHQQFTARSRVQRPYRPDTVKLLASLSHFTVTSALVILSDPYRI
jgi:hypothetical protein